MTEAGGPFVIMAGFAESLQDNDDCFDVRLVSGCAGRLPPASLAGLMPLRFVLLLETGDLEGSFPLVVRFRAPSGTELTPLIQTLLTLRPGKLAVVDEPCALLLEEEGPYRASVYFDGRLLTRASLIVRSTAS